MIPCAACSTTTERTSRFPLARRRTKGRPPLRHQALGQRVPRMLLRVDRLKTIPKIGVRKLFGVRVAECRATRRATGLFELLCLLCSELLGLSGTGFPLHARAGIKLGRRRCSCQSKGTDFDVGPDRNRIPKIIQDRCLCVVSFGLGSIGNSKDENGGSQGSKSSPRCRLLDSEIPQVSTLSRSRTAEPRQGVSQAAFPPRAS